MGRERGRRCGVAVTPRCEVPAAPRPTDDHPVRRGLRPTSPADRGPRGVRTLQALLALCDRGIDLGDCIALPPSPEGLEQARPWLDAQDLNPDWPEHARSALKDLAQRLGHVVWVALGPAVVLPVTRGAADIAASANRYLARKGQALAAPDTLIAGVCIAHGLPLLTGNTKHFGRVPGLEIVAVDELQ